MNLDYLDQDELLVEFEVRGMGEEAKQAISEELKKKLQAKLTEEVAETYLQPQRAHSGALKQPQTEAEVCLRKTQALRTELLDFLGQEQPNFEELRQFLMKLNHIQGRIYRSSTSPTFQAQTTSWTKNFRELITIVGKLKSKLLTAQAASGQVERLIFEKTKKLIGRASSRRRPGQPNQTTDESSDEDDREDLTSSPF